MTKYESQVYSLPILQESAFARLANLRNFEQFKTAFSNPAAREQMLKMAAQSQEQIDEKKLEEISQVVQQMQFTSDSVTIPSKMGLITLAIVERNSPKLVKLETQGAPVQACLWIQLLPQGTSQAAMKITIGAELNFFIRKMVEKHLKKAPDTIATVLAQILPALPELPLDAPLPSSDDFEEIKA